MAAITWEGSFSANMAASYFSKGREGGPKISVAEFRSEPAQIRFANRVSKGGLNNHLHHLAYMRFRGVVGVAHNKPIIVQVRLMGFQRVVLTGTAVS
jgi:hypothetical protein